jgi:hypothetical protein
MAVVNVCGKAGRSEMGTQRDREKERYWEKVICQAARSGESIREFCARRELKESQFYRWQRKLRQGKEHEALRRRAKLESPPEVATFALVGDEPGQLDAGIELVLGDGRRLRISRGVDEETLRTVLSVLRGES